VLNYLLKRVLIMVPTLFGILVVSFLVIRLAPGDPASQKFGGSGQAVAGVNAERGTEAAEKKFREKYHFDKPLYSQFFYYLQRVATGEMIFFQTGKSIWPELWDAIRVTLLMNLIVFFLIYATAVPLGILSAVAPRTWSDQIITLGLFLLYSLPTFWAAELLRMWLAPYGVPILGLNSDNAAELSSWGRFVDYLKHIFLPVLCQAYSGLAYISRQMRAGMLEVIRQDYIRTAYAVASHLCPRVTKQLVSDHYALCIAIAVSGWWKRDH
jgi:peptide/nickel transport system permease protein